MALTELLDGLIRSEIFARTDEGCKIAILAPPLGTTEVSQDSGSAFDLLADLIGTANGPRDLSDQKKYLSDFGLDGQARREESKLSKPV